VTADLFGGEAGVFVLRECAVAFSLEGAGESDLLSD